MLRIACSLNETQSCLVSRLSLGLETFRNVFIDGTLSQARSWYPTGHGRRLVTEFGVTEKISRTKFHNDLFRKKIDLTSKNF